MAVTTRMAVTRTWVGIAFAPRMMRLTCLSLQLRLLRIKLRLRMGWSECDQSIWKSAPWSLSAASSHGFSGGP